MSNILALIWSGIIASGIILYVVLDGFDMGIGILSFFIADETDRDIMVSTILPVWDGNQTWLVFGGAALYGAFPLAFSIILPLLYLPILLMVLALLFRGIAFEFRLKSKQTKRLWEICFSLGSLIATIAQGLMLGSFVQGFKYLKVSETTGFNEWLNPFSIACAGGLICGYVLLGSNFLIIKTEGKLQDKFYGISNLFQYLIFGCFIIVSIWSPFLDPAIMQRWFNPHNILYLAILPLITVILSCAHLYAIKNRIENIPFWSSVGIFIMCYVGFIVSIYPFIIPRKITYWQAAADKSALAFMLIGAFIMMPPLLFYTYHSYRIFKGKVTQRLGY